MTPHLSAASWAPRIIRPANGVVVTRSDKNPIIWVRWVRRPLASRFGR